MAVLGDKATCAVCHGPGTPESRPSDTACIGCRGAMDKIPTKPNRFDKFPHASAHYGNTLECTTCHAEHKPSKALCNDCHNVEWTNFKKVRERPSGGGLRPHPELVWGKENRFRGRALLAHGAKTQQFGRSIGRIFAVRSSRRKPRGLQRFVVGWRGVRREAFTRADESVRCERVFF